MPMPTISPPHPESSVELLQWLIEIRRIHERRGFRGIPAHDAIVLALLNTGAMFPWTLTCQTQFESVNNAFNFTFVPNVHVPRGVADVVLPAGVPHQVAAAITADPSRTCRHGPMRRGRGQASSNSVPAQLTLVRASPPYRPMHRPRILRTSQQRVGGGSSGLEHGVHSRAFNPLCTLCAEEAGSSQALMPATAPNDRLLPLEDGTHNEGAKSSTQSVQEVDRSGRSGTYTYEALESEEEESPSTFIRVSGREPNPY